MQAVTEPIHARVLAGETISSVDQPWKFMRNGRLVELYYTIYFAPVCDDSGAIAGILITSFETTDRVRAREQRNRTEQALRESQSRLKSAVDLVGLSCYSWNPATNTLQWDSGVKKLWGLTPDAEVTEAIFRKGVHPDDLPAVDAAIAKALDPKGDGVYHMEYRVIGSGDGVERWVSTHGQTRFVDGKPVDFIGVVRDITHRRRAETMLRQLNADLEELLMEQSTALAAATENGRRQELQLGALHVARMRAESQVDEDREREVADARQRLTLLSRREREVLDRLAAGHPNKTIAAQLCLSVRTVEVHRARMMQRLGVRHLAEAIRIAVTAQLAGQTRAR
jgi:PAS domain S-box-containing protein